MPESQKTPEEDILSELDKLYTPKPQESNTSQAKQETTNPLAGTILEDIPQNSNTQEESQDTGDLIDINITSLEDIVLIIEKEQYDFCLLEPEDARVKVTFRQDNIDRDVRYIKYPSYTNILFKTKQTTHMVVEDAENQQEGKWELKLGSKLYKITSKTAPWPNGERVFIHSKVDTTVEGVKKAKRASMGTILGFLWAILVVGLVLAGIFIGFIVYNAKTVEDVQFFSSLWINLNDINSFISQLVTVIFSILLFITTALLSFVLFKFLITKKSYKRKKVVYGVLSTLMILVTLSTASAWMVIDRKIKELPNWQEQAYGDLKIFDNNLLISEGFSREQALIGDTQNLIWPITLQLDLQNFQDNQARKGYTINKYVWDFGNLVDSEESFTPKIVKSFTQKWNYELSITAVGTDARGDPYTTQIENLPTLTLSHTIDMKESIMNNGGKKLNFDAQNLEDLWKLNWYFYENNEWRKISEGYRFIPAKIFFEELVVGISIQSGDKENNNIDKVLIISPDARADIQGNIVATESLENEREYNFIVKDAQAEFSNGFIEKFVWTIENKRYETRGINWDQSDSPVVIHTFKSFGEQKILVELTDTTGKTNTLETTLNIQKRVELASPLIIRDENNDELETMRYEEKTKEYFIDSLGIPSTLKFDARLMRPKNPIYSLKSVEWDVENNKNIDGTGKIFSYEVPTPGNHVLRVRYIFEHRRNSEDIISLDEMIFIEWVKKEAIVKMKIEKDSNYAPVSVRFDASESYIKNDDIIKFIYDYGDGEKPEERDAINPWHRYTKAGDYTVKLTVIGKSGKRYSLEKELILLPTPQNVEITSSLKRAPVGQGIDFSSNKSTGQIVEYFWNFGDGNISTEANPTHNYKKAGNYTVKLQANFINKNTKSSEIEIEIYEE